MSGRKKKSGGVLFRWLWIVGERCLADESLTTERQRTIMLVAQWRVLHADADGRNCYPSQSTLAMYVGAKRATVRAADDWLVRAELMMLTKNAGRGTSKRYRLVLPPSIDGSDESHSSDRKMALTGTIQAELDGPQDGPHDGAQGDHNLPPPNVSEEEEESASARFADAPLAALPSERVAVDLFTDDWPVDTGSASSVPQPEPETGGDVLADVNDDAVILAGTIARGGECSIESRRVVPALKSARVKTGWGRSQLATYCIEKLRRVRPTSPSGFLVTDLGRLDGHTEPSPRMVYAARLDDLDALDNELEAAGLPFGDAGTDLFDALLVDAGVVEEGVGYPEPWDVKPAQLHKCVGLAWDALRRRPDALGPRT